MYESDIQVSGVDPSAKLPESISASSLIGLELGCVWVGNIHTSIKGVPSYLSEQGLCNTLLRRVLTRVLLHCNELLVLCAILVSTGSPDDEVVAKPSQVPPLRVLVMEQNCSPLALQALPFWDSDQGVLACQLVSGCHLERSVPGVNRHVLAAWLLLPHL